jgi:hypothetical protein
VLSALLNVTLVATHCLDINLPKENLFIAVASMIMFIRIFYWMRFFAMTGHFVRLILDSVTKVMPFTLLFVIILFTFGTPLYIVGLSRMADGVEADHLISQHFNFLPMDIFTNMYLLALGEFESMDSYDGLDSTFVWIIFLLAVFIIQITFLNVIIAIMGGVYEEVMEMKEPAGLKEKFDIFCDYSAVLTDKNFNHMFLVVAELVEDDDSEALAQAVNDLDGKMKKQDKKINKIRSQSDALLAETKSTQAYIKLLEENQRKADKKAQKADEKTHALLQQITRQ